VTNLSFLNSNSVFTGTARWMGIVTLTNTGNIFVGDGAGLTGVGVATSGGLATNLTATGLTVATGQTNTHLTASSVVVTDANKGIVSGTTTADLATLSANQTFTGTNTFPAASFYPANNIGMRVLWACPSNIFLPTLTVNGTANATNNGDYVNTTSISFGTIPPLLSSNSMILMTGTFVRTNANSTAGHVYFYIGSNTNFVGGIATVMGVAAGSSQFGASGNLIAPGGSMTTWMQGSFFATPLKIGTQPFFDGTVSNDIYIGCTTATSFTNALIYGLRLVELYGP